MNFCGWRRIFSEGWADFTQWMLKEIPLAQDFVLGVLFGHLGGDLPHGSLPLEG